MKTAIITGGNSGVGKATAKALATSGYRVIIHGRDEEKTKAAVAEIRASSGNANVDYVCGDVSSIAGMKAVGNALAAKVDVLDVLVLSTGLLSQKRIATADGLEALFTTQFLSRFAITNMLLPALQKSKDARIIHVGAPLIKGAEMQWKDLGLTKGYNMIKAMKQCMLANHLFVQEFARRHEASPLHMNMAYPGVVKTGIARELNPIIRLLLRLVAGSVEKASRNVVYLATHPAANFSGYFLGSPGHPEQKEKMSQDPELAKKLWEVGEGLL